MTDPSACEELAQVCDEVAAEHSHPQDFLVELGYRVAGIGRSRLPVVGLVLGGRNRIRGGGFRAELRDRTAGQARHFAGTARAVTVFGAERTEWLSVRLRRDPPDSPDGRLTTLAVEFAGRLLDGSLPASEAGDWIRSNVCE
jgi:hypothetical protein